MTQTGLVDGSGYHPDQITSPAPPQSVLTIDNALSLGNVVLDEIIQLELGGDVPASLIVTALASSITTNLQRSNLVLSDISAQSIGTSFAADLSGAVGSYLGGQIGAELGRDIGIGKSVGSLAGGQLGLLAGDELAGAVLGDGVQLAPLIGANLTDITFAASPSAPGLTGTTLNANNAITYDPFSAAASFAGDELATLVGPTDLRMKRLVVGPSKVDTALMCL